MTIWHKRKRNCRDMAYGSLMTLCLVAALYTGLGRVEAYEIDNQEVSRSGCSEAEAIDWLATVVRDTGYRPEYAAPPRRPE